MAYVGKITDTAGNTHLVGSTLYGTCGTAAATTAKTVTCTNFSGFETGVTIHVKFTYGNTASAPTLNVNSKGAKTIQNLGSGWDAGAVVSFTYDGSYWVKNSSYSTVTSLTSGTTSTSLPTAAAVADYVDSAVAIASAGGLTYKGTVTALTDITNTNYKTGWYWMVGSNPSITIDGQECEAGDMIIAKQDKTSTADNDLDVIQSNLVSITNAQIDTICAQ